MLAVPLPQDPDAASGKFGFPVDNTIGGTPQANGWMDSWVRGYRGPADAACCCCSAVRGACAAHMNNVSMVAQVDFYRERRLRPMLNYANDSEMSRLGDVLMRNLDSLFEGIEVGKSVASRRQAVAGPASCAIQQSNGGTAVSGVLHRSSRLCCMATCGLATSGRRTDSPQCTTLRSTTAITRCPAQCPVCKCCI